MLLPKKLTPQSKINFVHTASPVSSGDWKKFSLFVDKLKKNYPNCKVFDVERRSLDPRYLAASENERLKKFKQAIKEVDWLAPIYGGTGCSDIIRYLKDDELYAIRRNRPIVSGFSDNTFLLNFLYFKLRLLGFHYFNACGLLSEKESKSFFDVITGQTDKFSYKTNNYYWLHPNEGPQEKIEGIAIGGNFETFRDLLDVCEINPRSWEDYILFIEDIDIDLEGLHRIIISLDQRNIFMHIKALVIGRMNEKSFEQAWAKLNFLFGAEKQIDHLFEYLISDVIEDRVEDKDPLYMLKVDNLGHGVKNKDNMLIPVGAKTTIYPDGRIEFEGPFVE